MNPDEAKAQAAKTPKKTPDVQTEALNAKIAEARALAEAEGVTIGEARAIKVQQQPAIGVLHGFVVTDAVLVEGGQHKQQQRAYQGQCQPVPIAVLAYCARGCLPVRRGGSGGG